MTLYIAIVVVVSGVLNVRSNETYIHRSQRRDVTRSLDVQQITFDDDKSKSRSCLQINETKRLGLQSYIEHYPIQNHRDFERAYNGIYICKKKRHNPPPLVPIVYAGSLLRHFDISTQTGNRNRRAVCATCFGGTCRVMCDARVFLFLRGIFVAIA